jgi:inhibitor of cysteine peptidase
VEFYTCDDFAENPHITDDIEMRTNKAITLSICSNPTTGFQWGEEVQLSNPEVLEQTSYEYVEPTSKEVGASGTEKYTLKALKAGTCTVSLEYSRPWEGGEKAEWTCILNITVK